MKRSMILFLLLNAALLASANPFLGRWECAEVDNTRLSMDFRGHMKVTIRQKQSPDAQEVGYQVDPGTLQIRINGSWFNYLFTDDNHFILFPDLSGIFKPGTSREAMRRQLWDLSRSHSLYTGRRAR